MGQIDKGRGRNPAIMSPRIIDHPLGAGAGGKNGVGIRYGDHWEGVGAEKSETLAQFANNWPQLIGIDFPGGTASPSWVSASPFGLFPLAMI